MRKILVLVLAITTIFAFAVPVMANKNTTVASTFEFDVNNANFHCNNIVGGGNGRVWPDLTAFGVLDGKGNGSGNNKDKMASKFNVTRVGDSTKWSLNDTVVCPSCKSEEWVTFSNNSGVPNGNNVQFQHSGPPQRWITISVFYNVEIPECEFTCVNDGAKCDFECSGCECDYEAIEHDCKWDCGVDHDCPFDADLTCGTVCDCAVSDSERIINIRELIVIADGLLFEHTAPDVWKDGDLVTGSPISEILYNDAKFDVYYVGEGDCECECKLMECDAVCGTCNWPPPPPPPPPHVHIALCDNCKSGVGKGNHGNCENGNNENKTNYFCLTCDNGNNGVTKLGAYIYDDKTWAYEDVIPSWKPVGSPPGICQCTQCN